MAEYERALEDHHRVKRQFFTPDNTAVRIPFLVLFFSTGPQTY